MRNKDAEKRLISSLQDNSQMSPSTLDAAKLEMKIMKPAKGNFKLKFAVVGCVLAVLCLAIVLPIVLSNTTNGYDSVRYDATMQEYLINKGILINTFDKISEEVKPTKPIKPEGGHASLEEGTSGYEKAYSIVDCQLIKYRNKDFCIKESYLYRNTDKIENYVVLNRNIRLEKKYFSDFSKLDKKIMIKEINLAYSFDEEKKVGKCKFDIGGYVCYVSINTKSEEELLSHIQKIVDIQKFY